MRVRRLRGRRRDNRSTVARAYHRRVNEQTGQRTDPTAPGARSSRHRFPGQYADASMLATLRGGAGACTPPSRATTDAARFTGFDVTLAVAGKRRSRLHDRRRVGFATLPAP
jgi:hypothetical protein